MLSMFKIIKITKLSIHLISNKLIKLIKPLFLNN